MMFVFNGLPPIDLIILNNITKAAGASILTIYNQSPESMQVTLKEDESPLTVADSLSHELIFKQLTALTPHIPIISEEGKDIPYDTRKTWEYFWCVDPLDG